VFRLNRNKQKTNRNSLTESIFWYFFAENLGLFQFVSVCFETVCFVSRTPYLEPTGEGGARSVGLFPTVSDIHPSFVFSVIF
jgi:hypothetical protein